MILEVDQFEAHKEDGEFLLPPTKCKITNTRTSNNKYCKGIIEAEVVSQDEYKNIV